MPFNIEWDKRASKELDKLPKEIILKILDKVEGLRDNPFHKKLTDSDNSFRMRVGEYRVIYEIEYKNNAITIYRVRHRKNVYKR